MKKILDALLMKRLENRFSLQDLHYEDFAILEKVQPITNFDELLKTPRGRRYTAAVSATGAVTLKTVPDGKRWSIVGYRITKDGGTFTYTSLEVLEAGQSQSVPVDQWTAASSNQKIFAQAIPVDEAWSIMAYVDSYSAPANAVIDLLYYEEDAY